MSVAFVPQDVRNGKVPVTPETIQKLLDENCQLINCISEYQTKGRAQECAQYQQILHRNLVWLATVADSNQPGAQQNILGGTTLSQPKDSAEPSVSTAIASQQSQAAAQPSTFANSIGSVTQTQSISVTHSDTTTQPYVQQSGMLQRQQNATSSDAMQPQNMYQQQIPAQQAPVQQQYPQQLPSQPQQPPTQPPQHVQQQVPQQSMTQTPTQPPISQPPSQQLMQQPSQPPMQQVIPQQPRSQQQPMQQQQQPMSQMQYHQQSQPPLTSYTSHVAYGNYQQQPPIQMGYGQPSQQQPQQPYHQPQQQQQQPYSQAQYPYPHQ